jgi:hypothetical protein
MACVKIIPLDRQETFSIGDRWKDLCAVAEMLPGFSLPERCAKTWRKGYPASACDDLENILTGLLIYCRVSTVGCLEHIPIIWGESFDDRRAIRANLIGLDIFLGKALRKEAASWQLLAAAELINKLRRDYQRLIVAHGKKCSCLTGHDARWRQDHHRH